MPGTFRAEHQRQFVRIPGGQIVKVHGVAGELHRGNGEPCSRCRTSRSAGQDSRRAQGTWNTVPMLTRTLRR